MVLRIATFNLENLDEGGDPSLARRIEVMRPQLRRLRADILCLQEVNGQERSNQPRQLLALQELISGTDYAQFHSASTHLANDPSSVYDERNLVILSRHPITDFAQHKHDFAPEPAYQKVTADPPETEADDVTWERPILYARIDLGDGRTLHLVNLHLKSRIPSNIPGQRIDSYRWRTVSGWAEGYFVSSMKRVGQALEVRMLIDQIFDAEPNAFIAVCGDFNSEIDQVPVAAIRGEVEDTGNGDLVTRVMLPCELSVPEDARYSLYHRGRGEMLDHLLVSRPMIAHYAGAEIHNELLHDESIAFATDPKYPESDHAPVVAEFDL